MKRPGFHIVPVLLLLAGLCGSLTGQIRPWEAVSGALPAGVVSLDAADDGLLFATTRSSGAYRSADGGRTWTELRGADLLLRLRAVAPIAGSDLMAATRNHLLLSRNGGDSWHILPIKSETPVIETLSVRPSGGAVVALADGSLFRRDAIGNRWVRVTGDWTLPGMRRLAIADDGTVYIGTAENGVYTINGPFQGWRTPIHALGDQPVHDLRVMGDRAIAATASGVFRTGDHGHSWARLGELSANVSALALTDDGDLYAAAGSAVYLWPRHGAAWIPVADGLPVVPLAALATAENGSALLAATREGGLLRLPLDPLASGSSDWQETGLRNVAVHHLASRAGNLYAATAGNGIYRSTDQGDTWAAVNTGLTNLNIYVVMAAGGGALYAGSDGSGVFRSDDDGGQWTPRSSGLSSMVVLALAGEGTTLYAGTHAGGVSVSRDGGATWAAFNAGLPPAATIYDIRLTDSGEVLAATTGQGVFSLAPGESAWRSVGLANVDIRSLWSDGGDHGILAGAWYDGVFALDPNGLGWTPAGLPNTHVMDFTGDGTRVFAATHGRGVFRQESGQGTWSAFNDGLGSAGVWSLVIDGDGYLYAGTNGSGVYRTRQSQPTAVAPSQGPVPLAFRLEQNYPNPFNPATRIRFELVRESRVDLRVHDALGREVAVLASGRMSGGTHEVRFRGDGLPSGVYYYTLLSGGERFTRRMVLLK